MHLEIRHLYDNWFTEDLLRKARIPEFRIPRRRDDPSQWICVIASDRKVLFFQLISDWDELSRPSSLSRFPIAALPLPRRLLSTTGSGWIRRCFWPAPSGCLTIASVPAQRPGRGRRRREQKDDPPAHVLRV